MSHLHDSITIRGHVLRNRITLAPSVKFDWTDESGICSPRYAEHYAARASKGVALIVTEAVCVCPEGRLSPTQAGVWSDDQIEGLAAIADEVHKYGTVLMAQLHHGGAKVHKACGSAKLPGIEAAHPDNPDHHILTIDEIHTIRDQFIASALRLKAAGYDGAQLHGCHGYLLNSFANPYANRRTDEYGGDTEGRTRLACEIIRGIRAACGESFLISVRTGADDPDLEESAAIARLYIAAGADLIQWSNGLGGGDPLPYPADCGMTQTCWMGTQAGKLLGGIVPFGVVNGIDTPEKARNIIESGLADLVDVCCALLADDGWAQAALAGTDDYIPCLRCRRCQWSPVSSEDSSYRCPGVVRRRKLDANCPC